MSNTINSFDIDGVIYMGNTHKGVFPGKNDTIITGRSFEEANETYKMLITRGINNPVHFNPLPFDSKTRETSGQHKASVIREFKEDGILIGIHFEDDPIQALIIRQRCPWVSVVLLEHNLVDKENVRHIHGDKK